MAELESFREKPVLKRIEFVVPHIDARKFSGGMLCIFEYANGLAERGHDVTVTPLLPSQDPLWFDRRFDIQHIGTPRPLTSSASSFSSGMAHLLRRTEASKLALKSSLHDLSKSLYRSYGYTFRRSFLLDSYARSSRDFDVSLATSFETALPVASFAAGKKFYFTQHYEPYFAVDMEEPEVAYLDACATYTYPLRIVANSTWLRGKIESAHPVRCVGVNTNAIDHRVFYPDGAPSPDVFTVISYGGRNATWKGFADAAHAIARARQVVPGLRWVVYGDALLPPDNEIAEYEPLGFITGAALRKAYSTADVILCPSWYESFPLFPLEAMACGTGVVSTRHGVEDYIEHEVNGLLVEARDVPAMTDAILTLHHNRGLLASLRQEGVASARRFTWERAVAGLEGIIDRES